MTELAPIIVFTYNRPWHTEQTLSALMQNDLASESILYVYCDGAKENATEEQKEKIKQVREVVKKNQWCKEVHITEAEQNKGLADSIIDGVTKVINKHGKVIVLEDDLVTSPYFLKYMNEALDFYANRQSVFSIGAYSHPPARFHIPKNYEYDVFVSLRNSSWGWATWAERWKQVDWSLSYLNSFLKNAAQVHAFNRAGEDMTEMLLLQRDKKIDSWAIRFSFAHFRNHAIAILPCVSYVDNIGLDGTGIHCGADTRNFRNDISLAKKNPVFIDVLYEDSRIVNGMYSYYYPKKRPLWQKVINRLSRMLGRKNIFVIKKKIYEK